MSSTALAGEAEDKTAMRDRRVQNGAPLLHEQTRLLNLRAMSALTVSLGRASISAA